MNKLFILDKCNEIFDRLTIIKGYLKINTEKKNIDYSLIMVYEINQLDKLTKEIVDVAKSLTPINNALCLPVPSCSKHWEAGTAVHGPNTLFNSVSNIKDPSTSKV